MTKTKLLIAVTLWLLALVAVHSKAHAALTDDDFVDPQRQPSIELLCDQIGGVVFFDSGELVGQHVKAFYVALTQNTFYFTNGIRLEGEIVGDKILFDEATLVTPSGSFACAAQ